MTPRDALLVSYPKSGSTWLRMVLGTALSGEDLDFDSVRVTVPPIGRQGGAPALLPGGGRLVRSHEPLGAVPSPGPRVVYLVRDGREVAASYYHHETREGRRRPSPAAFVEEFLAGTVDGYGPWVDHVLGAVQPDGEPPAIVVRYEAMRADLLGEVHRICRVLGAPVSESALSRARDANTKARMQAKEQRSAFLASRPSDGTSFVRPDGAPGWRELFDPAALARLEEGLAPALQALGYQ